MRNSEWSWARRERPRRERLNICLALNAPPDRRVASGVSPVVCSTVAEMIEIPRNHLFVPFFFSSPRGLSVMSVSPEFVEVNKGNKKHKAAGAGQLLRCPGLLKDNNKKVFESLLAFPIVCLNCSIWNLNLFAPNSHGKIQCFFLLTFT